MSLTVDSDVICDGCRGTISGRRYTTLYPSGQANSEHYHEVCWQTGWYTGVAPKGEFPKPAGPLSESLTELFDEIGAMMEARHEKYGPGNIAEFGDVGILVRMADKFARLKNGQKDFNDETIHSTLDDIIGYSLIWKMWLNGDWPGSEIANRENSGVV